MLIGLTGGFGSGKSTVLQIFGQLGAVTADSDKIVHGALEDPEIKEEILKEFGEGVINNNAVDRGRLAEMVFSSEAARKRLEMILHPRVFETIEGLHRKHRDSIVIAEIPLLFETGYHKKVDVTITVIAERHVIRERLIRKGFTEEEIRRRASAQIPLEDKSRLSDYVIDNSGTLEKTEKRVKGIWEELLKQ